MDIVKFENSTFKEIPKQDNPAYMTKAEFDSNNSTGCLLLCKQTKQKTPYVNNGRYAVLEINPVEFPDEQESVTNLGLFWHFEHAELFAEAFVKIKDELQK